MNVNNDTLKPGRNTGAVERPEFTIGFALIIPVRPVDLLVYPAGNVLGLTLLEMVVQAEFQHRGIAYEGRIGGSELNCARGIFTISDRRAGLRTIQECLEKCFLLPFAHIAWLDVAEGVWRPFFPPSSVVDFKTLCSPEVMEDMRRELLRKTGLLKTASAGYDSAT